MRNIRANQRFFLQQSYYILTFTIYTNILLIKHGGNICFAREKTDLTRSKQMYYDVIK